jgi:antitoxin component HigA of HigAB toxin-antitoxin module
VGIEWNARTALCYGSSELAAMVERVISTREQYEAALAVVEDLMSREVVLGSGEIDRLDMLAQAIEGYEKEHFPIDPPSPSEVVRFRLEQEGKVATLR